MDAKTRLRVVTPVSAPPLPGAEVGAVGDVAAIFRRYAPYVARVALRLLGRPSEVDDVVQDVFVDAVRGLRQVREPEALRGWLAAITVRVCSRRLRMNRLKRFFGFDAASREDLLQAPGASPEDRALLSCVYEALAKVPVAARTAWLLRYVEGEPLDAVAVACGCSLATAKRRIAAAEAHLDEVFGHET